MYQNPKPESQVNLYVHITYNTIQATQSSQKVSRQYTNANSSYLREKSKKKTKK